MFIEVEDFLVNVSKIDLIAPYRDKEIRFVHGDDTIYKTSFDTKEERDKNYQHIRDIVLN